MKTVEITTSKGTFLLVAVPKGATGFIIHKALKRSFPSQVTRLVYKDAMGDFQSLTLYYGHDECHLIGLASELTEEQIKEIVFYDKSENASHNYVDKMNLRGMPVVESFESLIASSGLEVGEGETVLVIKKV